MYKGVEFDPFKIRVIQLFPETKELDGTSAAHPILYNILGLIRILVAGNIGQGDKIVFVSLG